MKTLVLYYSKSGNNKFLAEKIAESLQGDIESIKTASFPIILLSTWLKFKIGIKPFKNSIEDYDKVIICGPIWMGQLIAPLRDVITKYKSQIKNLYFVTCSGSSEKTKDDKFGYAGVFAKVRDIAGDICRHCESFSITFVLPKDKQNDTDTIMKTRLSDDNFDGELSEKLEHFISICK